MAKPHGIAEGFPAVLIYFHSHKILLASRNNNRGDKLRPLGENVGAGFYQRSVGDSLGTFFQSLEGKISLASGIQASGEIAVVLSLPELWCVTTRSQGSWHSPAPSFQKRSLHGHHALLQQSFSSPWSPISFQVALKKMPLRKRSRKELVVNEIRVMKENRHPNIVNYIDRWVVLVLS